MSKDLNLCQFIGRLGSDPEIRHMQDGKAVANVNLAVGDDYKKDGQKVEQTEWVRLVAFGKLAELFQQYLAKGSRIYVSGKMKTRKWQDQSGQDRYSTEIVASDLQMLDSRASGDAGGAGARPNGNGKSSQPASNSQQAPQSGGFNDFEDDIPF